MTYGRNRRRGENPSIRLIACNGGTAFRYFRKFILPELKRPYPIVQLPSSSPAAARMSVAEKLSAWRELLSEK